MTKGVKIWLKNLAVCLFFRRFENRLYRASINSNQPYRWVAKHGVDTQAIVCSNHWDEDLSWTIFSRHPVVVYSKSIKSSPNYVKYNKAQEAISYLNYVEEGDDYADKKYSWLSDNWGKLFGNDLVLPRRVGFYAHAQFAVHRDCIWQYKKEFWLNLYEWCKDSQLSNYVASRVFEYTWYYIFSKNPVFR